MPDASSPSNESDAAIDVTAAAWLARLDRGLKPVEQDEYLEWRRADPRHRAALKRQSKTWEALDALAEWRPAHSARPNPGLLDRTRPQRWHYIVCGGLAAAAVVVFTGVFRPRLPQAPAEARIVSPALRVIPSPESVVLDDGSLVMLKAEARIEPEFSLRERRVRLVKGEAHFSVKKDSDRPFVVETGGIAVRAVGTAFSVRGGKSIEVLVTEGRVQLEQAARSKESGRARSPIPVSEGERAVVDSATPGRPPNITTINVAEMEEALAWQNVRLEFAELPLSAVVVEFNLRNRQQLVVGDPAAGRVRVGGTFRANNVTGFVRLLEGSFGLMSERRDDGAIVLRHRR